MSALKKIPDAAAPRKTSALTALTIGIATAVATKAGSAVASGLLRERTQQ